MPVGLDPVCLCAFDEAVHGGAGVSVARGVREEPVLPADHEGPDGPLYFVVVGRQEIGFKILDKRVPFFHGVGDRLTGSAGRDNFHTALDKPVMAPVKNGPFSISSMNTEKKSAIRSWAPMAQLHRDSLQ